MYFSKKYIVISPVRDEEAYIEKTIQSMVSQTLRPIQWIIVNDGSTDKTGDIAERYSQEYSWVNVIHRKNRGYRKAGEGVIEAFYDGIIAITDQDWCFIVKLDGDLSFEPDYFQRSLDYFDIDTWLGIAGGTVCVLEKDILRVDSPGDPRFHVRGATKIYRRQCWEKISPLVKAPGWDTIDEMKANLHGWTTRTFSDLKLIQLKPTGAADRKWGNWYKNGRANYITGYHPVFMLAKCLKRAFQKPLFVEAAALWTGFFSGYLKGIPRLQETDVIRYLRRQQIRRMLMLSSIYK